MKTRDLLLLAAVTAIVAALAFLQAYPFGTPGDPSWARIGAALHALNLTMIVTVLYVGLVFLQLCAMLRQHEAQDKLAREQLNELKGQADQARRSADLAERSAQAAEQTAWTAKQDMTLGQRAWVIAGSPELKWSTPLPLTLHLQLPNVGPTPALELEVQHCLYLGHEFRSAPQDEATTRSGSLGPRMSHTVLAELHLTETDTRALLAAELKLFFSGIVSYNDVFRQRHFTSWAFEYDTSSDAFVRCSFHNEMFDGAPPEDLAE